MKNIFKEDDCFEQTIAINMHNPQMDIFIGLVIDIAII